MITAVNAPRAGRQNRVFALGAIQRAEAISRIGLAEEVQLTPATISRVVRDLVELRLVASTGEFARRKKGAGAPSELLSVDGSWHRVISIHHGVTFVRVGLHDISCQLLASERSDVRPGEVPHLAVQRILKTVEKLTKRSGVHRDQLRGVGVGAVGHVDPASGTVRVAPSLGWEDVPLRDMLRDALELDVVVRNNVHAMAAGELRFAGVAEDVAVYVYVGTGIGAAIISGGNVHGGEHGAAGEIGHLYAEGDARCSCGKVGCLETVAAEPAVAKLATWIGRGAAGSTPRKIVDLLVEAMAAGDPESAALFAITGARLGKTISQVADIIDPGAIIIGGPIAAAGDVLLDPVRAALKSGVFSPQSRSIGVRCASFGIEAGMVGAATLALEQFVYNPESALLRDTA